MIFRLAGRARAIFTLYSARLMPIIYFTGFHVNTAADYGRALIELPIFYYALFSPITYFNREATRALTSLVIARQLRAAVPPRAASAFALPPAVASSPRISCYDTHAILSDVLLLNKVD